MAAGGGLTALVGLRILARRSGAMGAGLFVVGASVATWALLWGDVTGDFAFRRATRLAAVFCAVWCAVALAASIGGEKGPTTRRTAMIDAALIASLLFGVAAAVTLVFGLTFIGLNRLLRLSDPGVALTGEGATDLALLVAAILLWRAARSDPQQPTVLLLGLTLSGAWLATMGPIESVPSQAVIGSQVLSSGWWHWAARLTGLCALLVVGAAAAAELSARRRFARAWPDRLELLVDERPSWPGYLQLVAVLSAAGLLMGVYQLGLGGPAGRGLTMVLALAAGANGAACLFLTQRQWSANLFGLGAAQLTLAAATASTWFVRRVQGDYEQRLPVLLNAMLLGLACMTLLWLWLGRFWRQQLLDGRAWTAAGHAIPYARRCGFLVGALALLLGYQMAFWPLWRHVVARDDSFGRWAAGCGALGLLVWVLAREARRYDSATIASLAVAGLGAVAVFVLARWRHWGALGWLGQYGPVVAAVLSLVVLGFAEATAGGTWRCFSAPAWFAALLVLPAYALAHVASVHRLPADWVTPMTLAGLGALYGLAASRERRRAFYVLSAALLAAGLLVVWRKYAPGIV